MILLSIKLQIWVILLCRFLTFSLNTWFCVTLKIDAIISVVSSFHCYVFCIWPILQQMTWFNWVDVITQTFSTCIQASVPEWSCSLVNCIIVVDGLPHCYVYYSCHCEWGKSVALPVIVRIWSRCWNWHRFCCFLSLASLFFHLIISFLFSLALFHSP